MAIVVCVEHFPKLPDIQQYPERRFLICGLKYGTNGRICADLLHKGRYSLEAGVFPFTW